MAEAGKPVKPPGFSECESCMDCKHWNGKDTCLVEIKGQPANYPADPDDTCDLFARGVKENESDEYKRMWSAHRARLERKR